MPRGASGTYGDLPKSHSEDRAKPEAGGGRSGIHIFPILSGVVSEASEKANGGMKMVGGGDPSVRHLDQRSAPLRSALSRQI